MSDFDVIAAALGRIEAHAVTVDQRLTAIEVRQEGTRVELRGISQRLDVGNERMDVANGRTSKNELRLDAIEDEARSSRDRAAGRAEAHGAVRAKLWLVIEEVKKPALGLVFVFVAAAGIRVAAFLLGDGVMW